MKSSDQARMIYEFCVIAARNKRILYYRDVLEHLGYASGVQGHAIRYGLELVWRGCAEFCVNGQMAGNCRLVWRHTHEQKAA
jgi:hypothetical protein